MTDTEAIQIALDLRVSIGADHRRLISARQAIVEWPLEAPPQHRTDRIAWLVRLGDDQGYTEVVIDDDTGTTLGVRRFG